MAATSNTGKRAARHDSDQVRPPGPRKELWGDGVVEELMVPVNLDRKLPRRRRTSLLDAIVRGDSLPAPYVLATNSHRPVPTQEVEAHAHGTKFIEPRTTRQ